MKKYCGNCRWWKMKEHIFLDGKWHPFTDASGVPKRMGLCLHKLQKRRSRHKSEFCEFFEIKRAK